MQSGGGFEAQGNCGVKLKIKQDLLVSWSLIVILPNHSEYRRVNMRCARTAAGQFLKTFCDHLAERDQQRKICRVGTSKGAMGMLTLLYSEWFGRITIKLQLTSKSCLIFNSTKSLRTSGLPWDFKAVSTKWQSTQWSKLEKPAKNKYLIPHSSKIQWRTKYLSTQELTNSSGLWQQLACCKTYEMWTLQSNQP